MSEGCWKCEAPASGLWDHCQRCGALSTANVEAVCRGVASVAYQPTLLEPILSMKRERVWSAWAADREHAHPTRHGAALAAFDAAWEAGVERLTDDVSVATAVLGDDGRVVEMKRLVKEMEAMGRVWSWEVTLADAKAEPPTFPCSWLPAADKAEPTDAEVIRQWCEETGAAWKSAAGYAALHFADGSLLGVRPGKVLGVNGNWLQYCDPAQWMGLRLRYSRVPDHVADAMVREAKRALGAEL